jgi:hypothetical protein
MVTTTVFALLSPLFPQTIELVVENNMSFPKEDVPAMRNVEHTLSTLLGMPCHWSP